MGKHREDFDRKSSSQMTIYYICYTARKREENGRVYFSIRSPWFSSFFVVVVVLPAAVVAAAAASPLVAVYSVCFLFPMHFSPGI